MPRATVGPPGKRVVPLSRNPAEAAVPDTSVLKWESGFTQNAQRPDQPA